MVVLGIETSCDETASAVTDKRRVLSSVVSSSIDLHKAYGGVVPEIASRYHVEYISDVFRTALKKAKKSVSDIDLVAATYGPGLCGSLLTGLTFAKSLSYALEKPFIGVNHIVAHLFANFIYEEDRHPPKFPFIGLVISGGHTSLYLCKDFDDFKILGRTQDDAVGEAFDKVAKILNLGYPGGPVIEKIASGFKGEKPVKFPRAYLGKDSLDFSFSGIKTAVLYYVKGKTLTPGLVSEIAYSFQEAVFDVICRKTIMACQNNNISQVVIGGGVACNKTLAAKLNEAAKNNGISLFIPPIQYCLDNAAMVGILGEELYEKGYSSEMELTAEPNVEVCV